MSPLGAPVDGHVATHDRPIVVEFAEHGADEPDDRRAVRKDADHVGTAADLAVESFLRVVRPDLAPVLLRERGEGEDLLRLRAPGIGGGKKGRGPKVGTLEPLELAGCTGLEAAEGITAN
jgi:hypothetical protein